MSNGFDKPPDVPSAPSPASLVETTLNSWFLGLLVPTPSPISRETAQPSAFPTVPCASEGAARTRMDAGVSCRREGAGNRQKARSEAGGLNLTRLPEC
jgi:hypothetical protein